MEIVLLFIMIAPGLCARGSLRYHFVNDSKTFAEAQRYCRERYTDLVTMDNMEDVNILNDVANLNNYSDAWIGLYEDVNSWRWSLAETRSYKDGEDDFRSWESDQPDNNKSQEHCAAMNENGLWTDINCAELIPAVCFDVRGLNDTFVIINNSMTWAEARSCCRAQHTDLASVRNRTENRRIQELVPKGQKVWIGLFRDTWKWSDGSNSTFRYWARGEPNNVEKMEACALADFSQSGRWEDWNCDKIRGCVCYSRREREVRTKQVIRLTMTRENSSLNLNDPAVMEDILKQLRQRLKDNGVNANVSYVEQKKAKRKNVFAKREEL